MPLILKNKSCELKIIREGNPTRSSCVYSVSLVSGEWPRDQALITACDNSSLADTNEHHFGGDVKDYGKNKKLVTVYID